MAARLQTRAQSSSRRSSSRLACALLRPPCNAELQKRLAGDTEPLYLAAQRGFPEVCRELLLAGANVDFAMPRGTYAKHVMLKDGKEGGARARTTA